MSWRPVALHKDQARESPQLINFDLGAGPVPCVVGVLVEHRQRGGFGWPGARSRSPHMQNVRCNTKVPGRKVPSLFVRLTWLFLRTVLVWGFAAVFAVGCWSVLRAGGEHFVSKCRPYRAFVA